MVAVTKVHYVKDVDTETMKALVESLNLQEGFFLRTIPLPNGQTVPCRLHGPAMGDDPVQDQEVWFSRTGPDKPLTRFVLRDERDVSEITVIGMLTGSEVEVWAAYGGPARPRNVGDVTLTTDEEKAEAETFWASHALSP
jgi:hypothetical protein